MLSIFNAEKYIQDRLLKKAKEVQSVMKEEVPVRTGALRNSISITPEGKMAYFVGSQMPAESQAHHSRAYFTEYGRGDVYPVHANYLVFMGDYGLVFTKHSKPAPAQQWVERTYNRCN